MGIWKEIAKKLADKRPSLTPKLDDVNKVARLYNAESRVEVVIDGGEKKATVKSGSGYFGNYYALKEIFLDDLEIPYLAKDYTKDTGKETEFSWKRVTFFGPA